MSKNYVLKLTSALCISGVVCRAGELVEVSELEAKNFLARGKAELATVEDGAKEDQGEPGEDDLSKLTKENLLVKAAELEICIGSGATKAQIIEAIQAEVGSENEGE